MIIFQHSEPKLNRMHSIFQSVFSRTNPVKDDPLKDDFSKANFLWLLDNDISWKREIAGSSDLSEYSPTEMVHLLHSLHTKKINWHMKNRTPIL